MKHKRRFSWADRILAMIVVATAALLAAGAFVLWPAYINPESARVLGLVPAVPVGRIKAVGNTASEGAKMALLSVRERAAAPPLERGPPGVRPHGRPRDPGGRFDRGNRCRHQAPFGRDGAARAR